MNINGSAVIALILILAWQPEVRGPGLQRRLLVLWSTTAFGLVQGIGAYMAMGFYSDANWDVPPGTGYLTGAVLIVSAVLTVIMTNSTSHTQVRRPRSKSEITASQPPLPFIAP